MDSQLHPRLSASKDSSSVSKGTSGEKPHPHIRSCLFCRTRKVKCDRGKPCVNCLRAGSECVYPSGPGRAPKRPRRGLDQRVLDRLAHLEALVRRLDSTEGEPTPAATDVKEDESSRVQQQFGRLVIDNTRSCYVSNILWANLGDEVLDDAH
jgi:Fungal Zn(2)-Cys(6) binuclear cluster domain